MKERLVKGRARNRPPALIKHTHKRTHQMRCERPTLITLESLTEDVYPNPPIQTLPEIWSGGLITSIHKNGNALNPSSPQDLH